MRCSACGFQHLQRAGLRKVNLFEALYFIIVTFSTVGYGDISPDYWGSRLFVIIMISVALVVLPQQFEALAHSFSERAKSGGHYSDQRAKNEKHVVLSMTVLQADVVRDFLSEFYAHFRLQVSPFIGLPHCAELFRDSTVAQRIGPPDARAAAGAAVGATGDLHAGNGAKERRSGASQVGVIWPHPEIGRMLDAEACFLLSTRTSVDRDGTDRHTILRSWAVKDFAPSCPQYVSLFMPQSKMHLKHAEFVVCEEEFKYAMMANNCICPGMSTFITLLLHTSRGQ